MQPLAALSAQLLPKHLLGAAFQATFARRGTELPQTVEQVVALTSVFAANPQKQQAWAGFLRSRAGRVSRFVTS